MKRRSLSTVESGYVVAEVEYDESIVYGTGGSIYPRFCVPLQLVLRGLKAGPSDMVFTDLQGRLAMGNDPKIADSLPFKMHAIGYGEAETPSNANALLEFPLDAPRIDMMEARRSGGDMVLQVQLELTAQQFGPPYLSPNSRSVPWAMRYQSYLREQVWMTIPRSIWVEKVLPSLGYGRLLTIEFPPFSAENSSWEKSFLALKEAQELHKLGRYDDSVGKCRLALEKFFDWVEETDANGKTRSVPVPKKTWQIKLGEATYRWLDESFSALKRAMNKTVHEAGPHYDQFESQMILGITAAFVAYVARNLPENSK